MQPFRIVTGRAAPLPQANIDTDVIIRIERLTAGDRSALGRYAFEALRYNKDGSERPDFVLNKPEFRAAPILLAGPNFGCGSSREGAVTALLDFGIRCVIAEDFGDIFYSNCFQNGLLPIRLPEPVVRELRDEAAGSNGDFTINLEQQAILSPSGRSLAFDIDPMRRTALLDGLDDIGLTLRDRATIEAWQQHDRTRRPWVWNVRQTVPLS